MGDVGNVLSELLVDYKLASRCVPKIRFGVDAVNGPRKIAA
jgi:hypothetical protein